VLSGIGDKTSTYIIANGNKFLHKIETLTKLLPTLASYDEMLKKLYYFGYREDEDKFIFVANTMKGLR